MSDHHFSYPVVVPLGAMTISGHSTSPGVDVDVADHRSPHSFMTMGSVRHSPDPSARTPREAGLVAITYELLDAHADTSRLVADRASDAEWQNHLVYLRDLQRVGREALARAALAPSDRALAG